MGRAKRWPTTDPFTGLLYLNSYFHVNFVQEKGYVIRVWWWWQPLTVISNFWNGLYCDRPWRSQSRLFLLIYNMIQHTIILYYIELHYITLYLILFISAGTGADCGVWQGDIVAMRGVVAFWLSPSIWLFGPERERESGKGAVEVYGLECPNVRMLKCVNYKKYRNVKISIFQNLYQDFSMSKSLIV